MFQWTHHDFLAHNLPPPTPFRTSNTVKRFKKLVCFTVEFLPVIVFFFSNKKEKIHQKFTPSSEGNHSGLSEILSVSFQRDFQLGWVLILSGNSGKSVLMYRWAETDPSTLLGRKPNIFILKVSILKQFCDLRKLCSSDRFKTVILFWAVSHYFKNWLTYDDCMVSMKYKVVKKRSICRFSHTVVLGVTSCFVCDQLQIDLSPLISLLCSW